MICCFNIISGEIVARDQFTWCDIVWFGGSFWVWLGWDLFRFGTKRRPNIAATTDLQLKLLKNLHTTWVCGSHQTCHERPSHSLRNCSFGHFLFGIPVYPLHSAPLKLSITPTKVFCCTTSEMTWMIPRAVALWNQSSLRLHGILDISSVIFFHVRVWKTRLRWRLRCRANLSLALQGLCCENIPLVFVWCLYFGRNGKAKTSHQKWEML